MSEVRRDHVMFTKHVSDEALDLKPADRWHERHVNFFYAEVGLKDDQASAWVILEHSYSFPSDPMTTVYGDRIYDDEATARETADRLEAELGFVNLDQGGENADSSHSFSAQQVAFRGISYTLQQTLHYEMVSSNPKT